MMAHVSIELLQEYAANPTMFRIMHQQEIPALEKHLASCDECRAMTALMQAGRQERRERAIVETTRLIETAQIEIPTRYGDGRGCLDDETFARFLEDLLPVEQKRIVEHHLGLCEYCKNAVIDARKTVGAKDKVLQKRLRWSLGSVFAQYRVPLISVGVGVAVIFFGVQFSHYFKRNSQTPISEPRVRQPILESEKIIELVNPDPDESVRSLDFVFRWKFAAHKPGYVYQLVCMEKDNVNAIVRLQTAEMSIPAVQLQAFLKKGKTYLWLIEAYDGKVEISRSDHHREFYIE